ncbi:hypothetical protein GCM10027280_05100 [Micromonospora polyrhachis]
MYAVTAVAVRRSPAFLTGHGEDLHRYPVGAIVDVELLSVDLAAADFVLIKDHTRGQASRIVVLVLPLHLAGGGVEGVSNQPAVVWARLLCLPSPQQAVEDRVLGTVATVV